jgi:hypothetical protein
MVVQFVIGSAIRSSMATSLKNQPDSGTERTVVISKTSILGFAHDIS